MRLFVLCPLKKLSPLQSAPPNTLLAFKRYLESMGAKAAFAEASGAIRQPGRAGIRAGTCADSSYSLEVLPNGFYKYWRGAARGGILVVN